jgi:hypothetical protein
MTDPIEDDLRGHVGALKNEVALLNQKVQSSTEATKAAIDGLANVLNERWKAMEQRFDLTGRQQQQSIDLVVATTADIQLKESARETRLASVESDLKVLSTRVAEQKVGTEAQHVQTDKDVAYANKRIDGLWTMLKSVGSAIAVMILGITAWLIEQGLAHTPHK